MTVAQRFYRAFMPLETLRADISMIRVLHDAVSYSKIADMGSMLPLLSMSSPEHHANIDQAAQALLAFEQQFAGAAAAR